MNDLRHSLGDIPALEWNDGSIVEWNRFGKLHRTRGLPAVKGYDNQIKYYLNGVLVTQAKSATYKEKHA